MENIKDNLTIIFVLILFIVISLKVLLNAVIGGLYLQKALLLLLAERWAEVPGL